MNSHLYTPTKRHHPALDVPEVLLHVFRYLLWPDMASLMTDDLPHGLPSGFWYPLLTCRQWYNVGSHAGFRTVTYSQLARATDDKSASKMLARCHRLHLKFPPAYVHHPGVELAIGGLVDLFRPHTAEPQPGTNVSAPPLLPLREVCLEEESPLTSPPYAPIYHDQPLKWPIWRVLTINGLSRQLTLLKLVFHPNRRKQIPLFYLLTNEERPTLSAELAPYPRALYELPLPHLKHLFISNAQVSPSPPSWSPDQMLQLTTFRLESVTIVVEEDLHRLLLAVSGASLEQLSLRDIAFPNESSPLGHRRYATTHLLPTPFLRRWSPRCPGLRCIKVGDWDEQSSFDLMLSLKEFFPGLQRLECLQHVNFPLVRKPWMAFTHSLTRLEIVGEYRGSTMMPTMLHRFLCSEGARQLQELYLSGIEYYSPVLNPGPSFDPPPPSGDFPERYAQRTGPWSCSSLKRLFLSINPAQNTQATRFERISRGVCGFVVTSCPHLVHLELRFTKQPVGLDPDGGLCFLGRLKDLEHFVLWGTNVTTQQGVPRRNQDQAMPSPSLSILSSLTRLSSQASASTRSLTSQRTNAAAAAASATRTTVTEDGLSMLRWMAVHPMENDYVQQWTNLARCRYLARLDSPEHNDAVGGPFSTLATLYGALWDSHYKHQRPAWTKQLEAVLGLRGNDGLATQVETDMAARMREGEGSCWSRLQTFTLMIERYDAHLPKSIRKRRVVEVPVDQYRQALQNVLPPQVQVEVQWSTDSVVLL